jgi:lipoyl(octanoyl) transferase
MINRSLTYCDLGLIGYKEAWDLQKELFDLRVQNKVDDLFLLCEHPHTYTLGKTAHIENLVGTDEYLEENQISVFNIDRGGDITYHGPGQIVGYPIISLTEWKQDTHKYLRVLEEIIVKTCADFDLNAGRIDKLTGVWINNKKIAAIGIKVSRWITMHGFAFNVNTDLSLFNGIIPCGIQDKEVTSLKRELGKEIPVSDVKHSLLKYFKEIFNYSFVKEEDPGNLIQACRSGEQIETINL